MYLIVHNCKCYLTTLIPVSNVYSSSKFKILLSVTRFTWYFIDLTSASQIPPKWGALGGINFQSVSNLPALLVPLKFEVLSLQIE